MCKHIYMCVHIYMSTRNTSCFTRNKCQPCVFLHAKKKTIPTWHSSESRFTFMPFHATAFSLWESGIIASDRCQLHNTPDQSVFRGLDIFLLRPCHCARGLYYLYRVDPKSWTLAEIKTSSLTSRGTNSGVCKRFRRAITRKTRCDRNFYHGAAERPEILITCPFCRMLSTLSR